MLGAGRIGQGRSGQPGDRAYEDQRLRSTLASKNAYSLRLAASGTVEQVAQFVQRDIVTEDLFVSCVNQIENLD